MQHFGGTNTDYFIGIRNKAVLNCDEVKRHFSYLKPRPFTIYGIINVETNHLYVGITSKTPEWRLAQHCRRALHGKLDTHFARAIRKYGPRKFAVYSILSAATKELAYKLEQSTIVDLRPEYNSTAGGEGIIGLRMSASAKAKMRAAKLRNPNSRAIAIAAAMKLARPIVCVTTGVKYESCVQAGKACGLSHSHISALCRNGRPSRKGFRFKYEDQA